MALIGFSSNMAACGNPLGTLQDLVSCCIQYSEEEFQLNLKTYIHYEHVCSKEACGTMLIPVPIHICCECG